MDPNSIPKPSKSITANYSAKGRANHEQLFVYTGRNLILNAEHRTVVLKQGSRGMASKQCRPKSFKIMNDATRGASGGVSPETART